RHFSRVLSTSVSLRMVAPPSSKASPPAGLTQRFGQKYVPGEVPNICLRIYPGVNNGFFDDLPLMSVTAFIVWNEPSVADQDLSSLDDGFSTLLGSRSVVLEGSCGDNVFGPSLEEVEHPLRVVRFGFLFGRGSWAVLREFFEDGVWHGWGSLICCSSV